MYKKKDLLKRENFTLVARLSNLLTKKGKKAKALKLVMLSLRDIKTETGKFPLLVLKDALDNLKPIGLLDKVRVAKTIYDIPIPISEKKAQGFALRLVIKSAKEKGGRNLIKNLSSEIIDSYNRKGISIRYVKNLNNSIIKNRAFIHFGKLK